MDSMHDFRIYKITTVKQRLIFLKPLIKHAILPRIVNFSFHGIRLYLYVTQFKKFLRGFFVFTLNLAENIVL